MDFHTYYIYKECWNNRNLTVFYVKTTWIRHAHTTTPSATTAYSPKIAPSHGFLTPTNELLKTISDLGKTNRELNQIKYRLVWFNSLFVLRTSDKRNNRAYLLNIITQRIVVERCKITPLLDKTNSTSHFVKSKCQNFFIFFGSGVGSSKKIYNFATVLKRATGLEAILLVVLQPFPVFQQSSNIHY